MDKSFYIKLISQLSDQRGSELIKMMEEYHKSSLREITFDEIKEYYDKLQVMRLEKNGVQCNGS